MEQIATQVSFPGMGLEFHVNRVAFHLGNIPVYWYGILIALGFILAILYVNHRAKEFGVDADRMLDVIIGGAIGGVIGARAYYVLFRWEYYGQNLDQILNTRSGGMAIYGGIIGGLLCGILMCKLRKVKPLPAVDLAAGGFLIGQAIGRWGNFVNIEAFGSNTSLPWGMSSASITSYLSAHEAELEALGMSIDPNMPVHPTFLYESLWCLLGFAVIAWYTKRRKFDGELILLYLIWYGAGRTVIEGLRTDSLMIPNTSLRVSQVLAATIVIVGVILWVYKRAKVKKEGVHLFVDSEEGQMILAGNFYPKKKAAKTQADSQEMTSEKEDSEKAVPSAESEPQTNEQENFPGNEAAEQQETEVSEDISSEE